MIEIDASLGEGGGQVLRSALALSALTGCAVRLCNIRANRRPPGLRPQHLAAVRAAAAICGAAVRGAEPGSQVLEFEPGSVRAGDYRLDIGTAGAATLVLQTVLLPLALADGPSSVAVTGGTHVPWSPPFEHFAQGWLPALAAAGIRTEAHLVRPGFYPRGGGEVFATVTGSARPRPLRWAGRARIDCIAGMSRVANLDVSIAERQRARALQRMRAAGFEATIEIRREDTASPGTSLVLWAGLEPGRLCAGALGARGKPAERVADEAADELLGALAVSASVDRHLADQLIVPLALAAGDSEFVTPEVTSHLLTNAEVVRRFLRAEVRVEGAPGKAGRVVVKGAGLRRA